MLSKLTPTQMQIVSALLNDYVLLQIGTESGNLLKTENGISNPHPDIATVKTTTIRALKRSKMIQVNRRQQWYKWFGPTQKAKDLFLSLYNTPNCQQKFIPAEEYC